MSDIFIGSVGGSVIICLGIFIFKESIKNFFASDILAKQEEYKRQNEKLKEIFEKELSGINAELTNYNTRYSYLKKEEIGVYKLLYSKLLRVVFPIKNYFKEERKDYSQLENNIISLALDQWQCPSTIKKELFDIDKIKNPNEFNEKLIKINKTHTFNQIQKNKKEFEEYFLDNELFVSDVIVEEIKEIIEKIKLFIEIINATEKGLNYTIIAAFCCGKTIKDAETIENELFKLNKSIEKLKSMLKKEITEN